MSMEKLFTDKGIAKAEAELRNFANLTPPVCRHERKTRRPPYCKPFEQFQECALIVLDLVVNRQREEIERLKEEVSKARRKALLEATSKFAGHSDYHGDTILYKLICMAEGKEVKSARPLDKAEIRAEAVKEFAEELKKRLKKKLHGDADSIVLLIVVFREINNLLKKVEGEINNLLKEMESESE